MSTPIPVEISARHVHLTQADWTVLFGAEEISIDHPISQRPQFAAHQRVMLRGPKGEIDKVAIVGPFRQYTQAELALSDAHRLGLQPPLTDSGALDQAVEVTIIGPVGEVRRPAAIIQKRHIHMNLEDAAADNLENAQVVSVLITGGRGARLDNVLIRVDPTFTRRLHLDTDEANACGVVPGMTATIVP